MDRAHQPRSPTLLFALAVAAVPLGVAVAASTPDAGSGWVAAAFATFLAMVAAVAALAALVAALRSGSWSSLLRSGASAALAGGAVAVLAVADSLALPSLAAGLMALAAELARGRLLPGRTAIRIGAAVTTMAVAEAVALLTVLLALGTDVAAIVLWAAAAAWLTAAIVARGPATLGAALAAAGSMGLALDRGGGFEGLIGMATIAAGQLLMLVAERSDGEGSRSTEDQLPELAARLHDAVLRFDGNLRLREWNASAGELLALAPHSIGSRIDDLLGISLADLPGNGDVTTSSRGVGSLEVAIHRSGSGVVAVIRDPALAPESDRLGEELRETIEELLRARRTIDLQRGELERSSTVDPLTGVASRGAILERLRIEVAQARRYRHPLAVVQLDVDDFGIINALHGIDAGDSVLREVALRMRLRVREADALGRCGSDGFLAALPHTDDVGAATFADALRHRLAQRPVHVGDEEVPVTVSIGVATMRPGEDLDLDGLLARVQEALDSARSAGGDRIALDRLHGLARIEPRDGEPDASAEPEAG